MKYSSGIGIVEILVAAALIAVVFFAVSQLAVVSTNSVHAGARKTEAAYLAQEGLEAARSIRDRGWTANIATLTPGTTYYLSLSSGSWSLGTTDPGLIDGLYTRTVVFDQVLRDGDDDIAMTGTIDPKTLLVTSTVSWSEKGGSKSVLLETYITDFLSS